MGLGAFTSIPPRQSLCKNCGINENIARPILAVRAGPVFCVVEHGQHEPESR